MSKEQTGARLQKKKLVKLNSNRANWLLNEITRYDQDRPLRKSDVVSLAAHMIEGTFMPEEVTLTVCEFDGKTYRMNGQHTANAVLLCEKQDKPVSFNNVRLHTYVADTMEDMRQLYARLDRGRSRTNAQVIVSLLGGVEGVGNLSPKITNLLPNGLAFWQYENSHERQLYAGERAALDVLGDYRELAEQVGAFLSKLNASRNHHGHMFRAPVVAALYGTFEKDAKAAQTFWDSVARGIGYDTEEAPEARLHALLRNTVVGGGRDYRGTRANVPSEAMYRSCLHAWNKFRAGENMDMYMRPTVYKSRYKLR